MIIITKSTNHSAKPIVSWVETNIWIVFQTCILKNNLIRALMIFLLHRRIVAEYEKTIAQMIGESNVKYTVFSYLLNPSFGHRFLDPLSYQYTWILFLNQQPSFPNLCHYFLLHYLFARLFANWAKCMSLCALLHCHWCQRVKHFLTQSCFAMCLFFVFDWYELNPDVIGGYKLSVTHSFPASLDLNAAAGSLATCSHFSSYLPPLDISKKNLIFMLSEFITCSHQHTVTKTEQSWSMLLSNTRLSHVSCPPSLT